jgi:hypothetical protein
MTDLLLDPKTLVWAAWALGLGAPVAVLLGFLACLPRSAPWFKTGLFWGLVVSGPLLSGLWFVFNSIEEAFGLDSIVALSINLALFCLAGLVLGFVMRRGTRAAAGEPRGEDRKRQH